MSQTGTWVKVAKVEGDWSLYPPESRFTRDRLQKMADCYDPAHRRAKVVCGYDPATGAAGPAHEMGRYLPTRGEINALRFDGTYLEADIVQAADHQGKPAVAELVRRGFTNPSIKRMAKSDLPGSPWYLEHVALLSGEPPGTPGIPPLSDVFRALDLYGLTEAMPFIAAEAPVLGLDGMLQPSLCRSLAECERSWIDPATPDDGPPAEEDHTMTVEELGAAVSRALAEALPDAVAKAVAPLQADLAAARSLAEEAKTSAAAATETARSLADATSFGTLEQRVLACTKDGRVPPAELDGEMETLRSIPAGEGRDKHVKRLEARRPMRLGRALEFDRADETGDPAFDARSYTGPTGGAVDPERADLDRRARSLQSKTAGMTYEQAVHRALAGEEAN